MESSPYDEEYRMEDEDESSKVDLYTPSPRSNKNKNQSQEVIISVYNSNVAKTFPSRKTQIRQAHLGPRPFAFFLLVETVLRHEIFFLFHSMLFDVSAQQPF